MAPRRRRSLFRHSGHTQAVDVALPPGDHSRIIAEHAGAKSGNGESRVDGESRSNLGPRFRKPPETRQSGRQNEMCARIIPVGFDRSAQPNDRLLFPAKLKFAQPGEHAPEVDMGVAGTEAQCLLNVTLGLLGLAEEKLAVANLRVRDG